MTIKFIVFALAFLSFVPIGLGLALISKKFERFLFYLLVFGTAVNLPFLNINFYSMALYRGTTRGFEFTFIDLITAILFFFILLSPRLRGRIRWVPFNFPIFLILVVIFTISILTNTPQIYGLFELHKWLRGMVLYFVCINYIRDKDDILLVLYALLSTAFYESFLSLFQRYIEKSYRIHGSFGHYNILGAYSSICFATLFSVAFDYGGKLKRRWLYWVAIVGAAGCVVLSISRGAMVSIVISSFFIIGFSLLKSISARKIKTMGYMVLVMFVALLFSIDTITDRFSNAPEASEDSRVDYNAVAIAMVKDKPLTGVGLNNFSDATLNTYFPRTGLNEFGTPAHNIYMLTMGETGIFGIIFLIILLWRFIFLGLKTAIKRRQSLYDSLALGITSAIFAFALQSNLEYIYRITSIFFLHTILVATLVSACNLSKEQQSRGGMRRG